MTRPGNRNATQRDPKLRRACAVSMALAVAVACVPVAQAQEAAPPAAPPAAAAPDSVEAQLTAGLRYLDAGDYASAVLEFETLLRLDYLPPDLQQRAEIYADAARRYLAGQRLALSGYVLGGMGNYRENSTSAGSGETDDFFLKYRFGGRLNYLFSDELAFNNSLDYRFRYYDASARRNDSDLRWNSALSRAIGDDNVAVGVRGRVSFRGNGQYRNDYGLYSDWRILIDEDNQVDLGAEYRRRRYPEGPQRERSRHIAELSAGWTRSLMDGKASFTLSAAGGRETSSRVDGDSDFYSLSPEFDFTINDTWSGFVFAWWQNDRYSFERIESDSSDLPLVLPTRNDDLYELGGGLIWEFAEGWSLNPEVLYIRDRSNLIGLNYSSIETWVMVRRDF
ncbi:MAG: hypothetical protein KA187_01105 [Arenimonas sp.]|nr:hypothetical protein [Arenimonas sp.]MBP6625990.1 hypothetical protein [Arenimonas sp.]